MRALDVSQWQGQINWNAVPSEIALIKMSGGDAGHYYDSKASLNYNNAKAAGKAVGMYHFAGATDPIAESDFFIRACSPLEENDVLVLDWEVSHPNPVEWCRVFIQHVKDVTGVIPLIYMNTSTENSHDWSPVINMNVGLWVADYRYTPDDNVPIRHWSTYVMHQYTSDGSEAGIAGRVDVNEWFGTKEQFQKYGFQTAAPEVAPPIVITPPSPVVPVTPPEPVSVPAPEPTPLVDPPQPPVSVVPQPVVPTPTLLDWIRSIIKSIANFLSGWKRS